MGGDYEQRDKAEKQGDKVEQLDRGINANFCGGFISTGGQPSCYPYPGGYAPPGYPASDYISSAHSPTVYASSYSTGYSSAGYTPAPYPTGYPSPYPPAGYNPAVYPPAGYNPAVYPPAPAQGPAQGLSGHPPAGCPPAGYPVQGAFAAGGSGAAAYNVREIQDG